MSIGIISQISECFLYKNTNGQGSTLPCLRETGERETHSPTVSRGSKARKNGVFMLEKASKATKR